MRYVVLVIAFLALGSGCGSDDSGAGATEVEQSLRAQLESDKSGRPVDLGGAPPRTVRCKQERYQDNWRCTVTPASGKDIVCVVAADPQTGKVQKTACTPEDY